MCVINIILILDQKNHTIVPAIKKKNELYPNQNQDKYMFFVEPLCKNCQDSHNSFSNWKNYTLQQLPPNPEPGDSFHSLNFRIYVSMTY